MKKRIDYKKIPWQYKPVIKWIFDTDDSARYTYIFEIEDKMYYCFILTNIYGQQEPHFGLFNEQKFMQAQTALENYDSKVLKELIIDREIIDVDGNLGFQEISPKLLINILSYVFTILSYCLNKKHSVFARIVGSEKTYPIYKQFINKCLEDIPYKITNEEVKSEYYHKNGEIVQLKGTILRYAFA